MLTFRGSSIDSGEIGAIETFSNAPTAIDSTIFVAC
jgi:hypothetical protein